MGAMKGVVRRLPLDGALIDDYIPVDIVVNTMIAGVWSSCQMPERYTYITIFKKVSLFYIIFDIDMFFVFYILIRRIRTINFMWFYLSV